MMSIDCTGKIELNTADIQVMASVLNEGGVAAVPTEGVWGLSCRVDRLDAVERILEIKARAPSKGLIVLVDDFAAIDHWAACPTLEAAVCEEGRPSTWVIPVTEGCPTVLTGGRSSLAVRRVKMPLLRRLVGYTGPLVSTSANRSGRPACRFRHQVILALGGDVDYVSKSQTQGFKTPSTIRDMMTGEVYRA